MHPYSRFDKQCSYCEQKFVARKRKDYIRRYYHDLFARNSDLNLRKLKCPLDLIDMIFADLTCYEFVFWRRK